MCRRLSVRSTPDKLRTRTSRAQEGRMPLEVGTKIQRTLPRHKYTRLRGYNRSGWSSPHDLYRSYHACTTQKYTARSLVQARTPTRARCRRRANTSSPVRVGAMRPNDTPEYLIQWFRHSAYNEIWEPTANIQETLRCIATTSALRVRYPYVLRARDARTMSGRAHNRI